MSRRDTYKPGPANAELRKTEGESWTLVLVRELRHPPEKVWRALTDPAELREWAPFDANRSLAAEGPVALTTVGAPQPMVSETRVKRADAPRLLEYQWGGNDMRWELEPTTGGTRLTLWASIDRRYIAMGAAGWHLCLDVLAHFLAGDPLGRIVGPDAMSFGGWRQLHAEYSKQIAGEA